MIISCPACQTRFNVDPARLGPEGRKVKCAKCAHVWRVAGDSQPAPGPLAPADPPPPAAPEAPAAPSPGIFVKKGVAPQELAEPPAPATPEAAPATVEAPADSGGAAEAAPEGQPEGDAADLSDEKKETDGESEEAPGQPESARPALTPKQRQKLQAPRKSASRVRILVLLLMIMLVIAGGVYAYKQRIANQPAAPAADVAPVPDPNAPDPAPKAENQ